MTNTNRLYNIVKYIVEKVLRIEYNVYRKTASALLRKTTFNRG